MNFLLIIFFVFADFLTLSMIIYWSIALYRAIRISRELPHPGNFKAGAWENSRRPSVCVVIPAHNEAGPIGRLINTLKEQDYPEMHVLLALDRCTDNTFETATRAIHNDARFEVVQIEDCPPDWSGKTHAVHEALLSNPLSSSCDYLLFLDADVWLAPMFMRTAVRMAQEHKYQFLSFLSTLTYSRWFEYLVQMPACLELMYQAPLLRVNRAENRQPFANGQMMLFERSAYFSIGGHASVKDALLEDLALAGNAARHGIKAGVLPGDGLLVSRMYDSWERFRKGWKRIYVEMSQRRVKRLRRWSARVLLVGAAMPLGALAALGLSIVRLTGMHGPGFIDYFHLGLSTVAFMAWITALLLVCKIAGAPLWTCMTFPIGSLIVAVLLRQSANELEAKKPMEWGGRSYVRNIE